MRTLSLLLGLLACFSVDATEIVVVDEDPVFGADAIRIYYNGWWQATNRQFTPEDIRQEHTVFLRYSAGADIEKIKHWMQNLSPSNEKIGPLRLVIDVVGENGAIVRSISVDGSGIAQNKDGLVFALPSEFFEWISIVTFSSRTHQNTRSNE